MSHDIDPLGAKFAFFGVLIMLIFACGAGLVEQAALAEAQAKMEMVR
jgi:hypothetical protein